MAHHAQHHTRTATSEYQRIDRRIFACAFACCEGGDHVLAIEGDHITPLSAGGDNSFENLQALCKSCHSRKTGKEQQEQTRKRSVRT